MSTLLDDKTDASDLKGLEQSYSSPAATQSGSAALAEKKELNNLNSTGTNNGGLYTGSGDKAKPKGRWKKKASIISGLLASLGVSIFVAIPLVGPLEYIHFAQSIRLPHFGAAEDAGDIKTNALLRYAKKRAAGETRLTYLESKYFDRITADMERSGFQPRFDSNTGYYRGLIVDTTSEKSPYRGMSNDEVKDKLRQKYGSDAFQVRDGKFYLQEGKANFLQQYRTLKLISKDMGYSGLTAAMRARVLTKYGVVTWNPLRKIDKKINQSIADRAVQWKKERDARIRNGTKTTIRTAGATSKDEEGKTTPLEGSGANDGDADQSKIKSVFQGMQSGKSLAAAGGVAAVAGVVCTAKAINDRTGEIKYVQLVEPLMREGTDAVTGGDQLASGNGFNDLQLEMLATLMRGKDKNGNVTEASQAESIRANNGGEGGVRLNPAITEALQNIKIPYLSWTEDASVQGLCSGVGTVITTTVSIGITVISGGFASAAAGLLIGPYFTSLVIDNISSLLSGEIADLSETGAPYGARADMGAKLAADFASMQGGGEVMSATESAELTNAVYEADLYAFSKKPVRERLFNVNDRRTLAGKLYDGTPKTFDEAATGIASMFTGSFSKLVGGFGTLSPSANAQSLKYNYGLPKFGFTMDELSDERLADPYRSGEETVVPILQGPNGEKYIEQAKTCYGVTLSKTAQGWDADPNINAYKTYFTAGERQSECKDKNIEWLAIRNFIDNTTHMNALTCYYGDGESCTKSGFGNGSSSQPTPTATAPSVLSDLSKESVSVPCATGTKDIGVMDGYSEGNLVKIRICAITGLKNIAGISRFPGDNGYVSVNSRLSAAWYALAQKAEAEGVKLEATSGFRTMAKQQDLYGGDPLSAARPGYSNHQMGLAIDVSGISGKDTSAQNCSRRVLDLGSPAWQFLNKNAAQYGIKQYSAEAWHWDPDPGGDGNRCGGDGSLRT